MTPGRIWAASLTALTALLLLQYPALFLWVAIVGGYIACAVWLLVVHHQRDEAASETWAARFETAVWKKKAVSLEAEAMRLHLELTEAQIAAGTVRVPLLRVVQSPIPMQRRSEEWDAIVRAVEDEA